MKYLLLAGAFLGVLGYAWFGRGDANVYAMAPADVYQALRSAPVKPGGTGVFGRLETSVSGNGDSLVYWNASGSHAAVHCEASITPEGTGHSRLTAYCGGGGASDGAAAGMVSAMNRKALIEHIDATLDKRPYDAHLAQGSTASGWPSDARQADGSYGTAVAGALKMERDIKQDIKQMEQDQAATDAVRAAQSGVQFQPGKPMVNVNPDRR
ncbi:MAG: hypothetical protein ABIR25_08060 [Sphingomicrobium sp.]